MNGSHYEEIIKNSLQRFRDLYRQREEIDVELAKLRQFLGATLNMVPEKQRTRWQKEIDDAFKRATANVTSLADSVRRLFQDRPDYGFTASTIRGMLLDAGFDFSSYVSNPLSSVSTTLRRMVETGELDTREGNEGVTIYIKPDPPRRKVRKTEIPY
jgi:hypothetical protein